MNQATELFDTQPDPAPTLKVSPVSIRPYRGQFTCKLSYWMSDTPKDKFSANFFGKTRDEVQQKVDVYLSQIKK